MPPPRSWGSSTPQAKPKPKLRSAASRGPAGGPVRGEGPRCPDTGGGGPSHTPLRLPGDVQSGPQGADTQATGPPAAGPGSASGGQGEASTPGVFNGVPLYSAMRRSATASGGQPLMGTLAEQGQGADAQGHGPPRGTRTPPLAAAGPPQGAPPGAIVQSCLTLPMMSGTAPAMLTTGGSAGWPCPAPHLAGYGWFPVLDAAARDAALPGLAAASLAAVAPPDAAALDHGNRQGEFGGGRALRFGEFDTNEDDDELWGEWGGDCSSGPVLFGTRPTETDDNCGFGGGWSAGWGCGDPAGTAYVWPPRRVGSFRLPRHWWLGCLGSFSPACCLRSPGGEGAVGPVGCEYAPACAE